MRTNNHEVRAIFAELRVLCQEQEKGIIDVSKSLNSLKKKVRIIEKRSLNK